MKICFLGNGLAYVKGGGHLWAYLNWALGLRDVGCDVAWLEIADARIREEELTETVAALKAVLAPFGLSKGLAVCTRTGGDLPAAARHSALSLEAVVDADLLLNMRFDASSEIVHRFRRAAFVDLDPGILQYWMSKHVVSVTPHARYFTIGETVGRPDAAFADGGVTWHHTLPCVALDHWRRADSDEHAPFSTVSHWYQDEWMEDAAGVYRNDKRAGFEPFLDLPGRVAQPLELALCLEGDDAERRALQARGWRIRDAWEVGGTPSAYQEYIRASRGEFSCAKPAYVRLQTAWISDRTVCYLASGKPALVQDTGPSRVLPPDCGLARFSTLEQAVAGIEWLTDDYDRQARLARGLAEELFDARKIIPRLLERAMC